MVALLGAVACGLLLALGPADEPEGPGDKEIWTAIPELTGERRIAFCALAYLGGGCSVTYKPEVIDANKVMRRVVICEREADVRTCRLSQSEAWYDTDPSRYFALEPGLALDEALPIVRAYFEKRLMRADSPATPWKASRPELRLSSIGSSSNGYVLNLTMCGCSARILVARRRVADSESFQVVEERSMCV